MTETSRAFGSPILFFALLVSASVCTAEKSPTVVDNPVYTNAQQLVEIEPGRKLNLYCLGTGEPTVVFDSGLTDETSVWGLVQPTIASKTRSCSYDRAGVGFSDPGNRPGSSANIVDDLHRLLAAAAVKPPYVLVGHSYGGMNTRLYANTYPSTVVGMVFIDPSHEDQAEGYRKLDTRNLSRTEWDKLSEPGLAKRRDCIAAAPAGFVPGTELYKQCSFPRNVRVSDAIWAVHSKIYMRQGYQRAQLGEEESVFGISADQVRAARRSFGDMPLIVLTSSPNPRRPNETQELRDAKNRLWVGLHDDIAQLSTRGVHRIVPAAGHYIQSDQPETVNDAILEVLKASRQRGWGNNRSF